MQVRKSVLLAVAFAALLLVTALSSLAVWRNARQAQSRVAQLHAAHMRAGAALAAIRANVYLTGILTRDYLLDHDPAHVAQYVDQFEEIRAGTENSFSTLYTSGPDAQQKAALDRLRHELQLYWDPTEIALEWTPEEKRAEQAQLLRQRVRRRQEIFALAGQAERLMTANFEREQERVTGADREFRASLGWTTGIALVFGALIAGLTLYRMMGLERQSRQAETELRRLSGQLRTAQEQERKFLSRELHDQVGQVLTGLRMELAGMARLHGDPESEFGMRLTRAKGTVEQTLKLVRNISMLVRPSMLDDLGLTPALSWLIKEVSRSGTIDIRQELDPALDSLPDAYRTCLYRVVQEGLTNCSRHSGAHRAHVVLKASDDSVLCSIGDDGRGFDPANRSSGLGLLGMEERVRELGGTLRIVSAPGRGTTLEIRLPRPGGEETGDDSSPDRGRSRDRADRVETSA